MGMNESWNNFWDDFGKNKTHAWLDSDPEDRKEGTALLSTVKRAATFGKKSSAELVIRTPMKTGDVDNDWCFSSRYVIVVRLGSESWVHRLDGHLSLSLSFSFSLLFVSISDPSLSGLASFPRFHSTGVEKSADWSLPRACLITRGVKWTVLQINIYKIIRVNEHRDGCCALIMHRWTFWFSDDDRFIPLDREDHLRGEV